MRRSLLVVLIGLFSALLGSGLALAAETKAKAAAKAVPARTPVKVPVPKAGARPAAKSVSKPSPLIVAPTADTKDARELVRMPSPARLAMRAEMRDRTAALDEVMKLLALGKVAEAGEAALERLGVPVWGAQQKLPSTAQPEQYMPDAMRRMALEGYRAASDFATVARTGDRETALAMLPMLTGSCANCHQSYRIR